MPTSPVYYLDEAGLATLEMKFQRDGALWGLEITALLHRASSDYWEPKALERERHAYDEGFSDGTNEGHEIGLADGYQEGYEAAMAKLKALNDS